MDYLTRFISELGLPTKCQKAAKTIKKHKLIKPKDKLLLGVSGGPDSMCLLRFFASIKREYSLKLTCVHFNHALRREADQEEQVVKEACNSLGINCISEKKEVMEET